MTIDYRIGDTREVIATVPAHEGKRKGSVYR